MELIHLDGTNLTVKDTYLFIQPFTLAKVNDGPFEMNNNEATFVDDYLELLDNQPYREYFFY